MEGMEEKLSAILGNPEMMEKIMGLAQSLNQPQTPQEDTPKQNPPQRQPDSPAVGLDPVLLRSIASMAGQSGIDKDQRALLQALNPYVSRDRLAKLENAMRAAKLARVASRFLGSGGIQLLTGR